MKKIGVILIILMFGCSSMTEIQKKESIDLAIRIGMLAVQVIAAFPPDRIIGARSDNYDKILIYDDTGIVVYIDDSKVVRIEDNEHYKRKHHTRDPRESR